MKRIEFNNMGNSSNNGKNTDHFDDYITGEPNEKIGIFVEKINIHYADDNSFYLQRSELNMLFQFLFKDSVLVTINPKFKWRKKTYTFAKFNLINKIDELMRRNQRFVLYDIERHQNGDLVVLGAYIE